MASSSTWVYRRHAPEQTALYRAVQEHLEAFLAHARWRGGLPQFVERELVQFLDCGILSRGFARFRCARCGDDLIVAFSCKGRGVCPSCGARRMSDTAAHLVERVFPRVPVRQWVLSLPHALRFLIAKSKPLCRAVRKIFARAVLGFMRRLGQREGVGDGDTGTVTFVQRFDSALRLNVHFHLLAIDGVYVRPSPFEKPVFHATRAPTDSEIAQVLRRIHNRVRHMLEKRGLSLDPRAYDPDADADSILASCQAASVQGKIALGEHSGSRAPTIVQLPPATSIKKRRCADLDGFSLHADVRVAARDKDRLERLCRYVARPAIANDRLVLLPDGSFAYTLKHAYKDGSTQARFTPLELLGRLAALIPPPRAHLVVYDGVLAANASVRDQIVPLPPRRKASPSCDEPASDQQENVQPFPRLPPEAPEVRRYSWADLLRRVFLIDALQCPCGGRRVLIAMITQRSVIDKILSSLGLSTEPPVIALARPPPSPHVSMDSEPPPDTSPE